MDVPVGVRGVVNNMKTNSSLAVQRCTKIDEFGINHENEMPTEIRRICTNGFRQIVCLCVT